MDVTPGCILPRAGDAVHDGPPRLLGQRSQKQAHVRKNLPENHGVPFGRCSLARPGAATPGSCAAATSPPFDGPAAGRGGNGARERLDATVLRRAGRRAADSRSRPRARDRRGRSGSDPPCAGELTTRRRCRRDLALDVVRDAAALSGTERSQATLHRFGPRNGRSRLSAGLDSIGVPNGRTPDSERRLNPRRVSPGLV